MYSAAEAEGAFGYSCMLECFVLKTKIKRTHRIMWTRNWLTERKAESHLSLRCHGFPKTGNTEKRSGINCRVCSFNCCAVKHLMWVDKMQVMWSSHNVIVNVGMCVIPYCELDSIFFLLRKKCCLTQRYDCLNKCLIPFLANISCFQSSHMVFITRLTNTHHCQNLWKQRISEWHCSFVVITTYLYPTVPTHFHNTT